MRTKNIVLIGFMGAGKTEVGRSLAERLGMDFFDVDAEIEKGQGRTVWEIFYTETEEGFRRIEAKEIESAALLDGYVIACGGGAVLRPDNVAALKSHGTFVYLKADPAELAERLRDDTSRPLLKGTNRREAINGLLREREALYESTADITVDTSTSTVDGVVESILVELDGNDHSRH